MTTWSSTSSTSAPSSGRRVGCGLPGVAAGHRRHPLGGVDRAAAGRHRGVDDREACRRPAPGGSGPGRRPGRCTERGPGGGLDDGDRAHRGPPVAEHLDARPSPAAPAPGRPRCPRGTGRAGPAPWPRSVSRATARPSSAASAILPLRSSPIAARPVGHILRGATTTPGRASRSAAAPRAASETRVGQGRRRRSCRTARTAGLLAVDDVVELVAQEAHPAPVGGQVVEHRLLLALAGLGDPGVALGVVDPRLAGRRPAALRPGGRRRRRRAP